LNHRHKQIPGQAEQFLDQNLSKEFRWFFEDVLMMLQAKFCLKK
jgi:hypothetical protein